MHSRRLPAEFVLQVRVDYRFRTGKPRHAYRGREATFRYLACPESESSLAYAVLNRKRFSFLTLSIDHSNVEGGEVISRTVALLSIAVVCVVALVTPVMADMLFGREASFSLTEPAALILLGAALICVGLWTRWYFFDRKRGL